MFHIEPSERITWVVDFWQAGTTFLNMSETVSIKISAEEKQRLRSLARVRQSSLAALIREGIAHVLESTPTGDEPSCYDLMAHIFEDPEKLGASGLGDLSTNKARLSDIGKK